MVLGVLSGAPASAAASTRDIGEVTSVVEDADIWGDDGPTGGLSVTGWVSEDYLGDHVVEIRAEAADTVGSVAV
ncbi:hypothetical protein [Cellulomonas denverensis]|uniref:Uncharacterized protein n=1 Tax=Cellulomonas denverensis TaxID=264297 RepID=A0A7X6KVV6_9CELL|nr:hypothetical protein [Cellulomonas denverensis]NKY23222.1 hypothetical protein [Cellulomonas denverensis]